MPWSAFEVFDLEIRIEDRYSCVLVIQNVGTAEEYILKVALRLDFV